MSVIPLLQPDLAVIQRQDSIIADLRRTVPDATIIADNTGRRAYETDALTAYRQLPLAIVMPTTTREVSEVLKYCHRHGVRVVGRGAGTSLCGGAIPGADAIVLSVARMTRILDIDYAGRTARVEAGITNLAISEATQGSGFFYAPDPSSQLACTIAGNIAMNSGGAHCLKYGVTSNNVMGVRMVLANGEIVDIGGDYLDAPGYDLLGLINGSEGQFGIITEATVRILRSAEGARPMLIGFDSARAAGACVSAIIASGLIPVALEFMDKPAIHVCEDFAKAGYPLDVEALLIVEVEGSDTEIDSQFDKIRRIAAAHNPMVTKEAQSKVEAEAIWKGRKSAFGAMGQISDYYCMDGVIPLGTLPDVLDKVTEICRKYGLRVANIFHAGDGNLHPLILYRANDPKQMVDAEECGAEILKLCVEAGGCLTGEHGVGIEKRELMHSQFSPTDLEQQTRLKSIFDPQWLLNPGKVFPLDVHPDHIRKTSH